jgi:alpha-beta hydrolase superfamily lysophospholipase
VINFINENLPLSSLGRLSFIGHSMGGLIVRAALPHLSKFTSKMFTYLSLGSPHLGYHYSSSKLVEAGIWFLKKWRKSASLAQLSECSSHDHFLMQLSMKEGLGWFK